MKDQDYSRSQTSAILRPNFMQRRGKQEKKNQGKKGEKRKKRRKKTRLETWFKQENSGSSRFSDFKG